MGFAKVCRQTKNKLSGCFVNGTIGKIYNNISFSGYMRAKTKHMTELGIKITSPLRYVSSDAYFDGHNYSLITIERDVTISKEVMLLTHDYSLGRAMSAIGIDIKEGAENTPHFAKPILIGESSFIGARASILPGTNIGKCCIIGACAVVKGNIPDYSIVIGNPGKVIGDVREWVSQYTENAFIREE